MANSYDDKLMDTETAFYALKQARVRFREFAQNVTTPSDSTVMKERSKLYQAWKEREKLFWAAVERLKVND